MLNAHHVICGDARDQGVMDGLFASQTAQMVFTDPPYNVRIAGNVSGLGANRHREFAMVSGEITATQFTDFLVDFLTTACRVVAEGAVKYICMDWHHLPELFAATERVGLTLLNLCVWAKTNAGMGTFYRSQHEMELVAKKETAPYINNFELGKKGRSRSNLWTYRKDTRILRSESGRNNRHAVGLFLADLGKVGQETTRIGRCLKPDRHNRRRRIWGGTEARKAIFRLSAVRRHACNPPEPRALRRRISENDLS